jgi:hypothetical protein
VKPCLENKPSMVVHGCNPSDMGGIGRRGLKSKIALDKNYKTLFEK